MSLPVYSVELLGFPNEDLLQRYFKLKKSSCLLALMLTGLSSQGGHQESFSFPPFIAKQKWTLQLWE